MPEFHKREGKLHFLNPKTPELPQFMVSTIYFLPFLLLASSCGSQIQIQNDISTNKHEIEGGSKLISCGKNDKVTSGLLDKAGNLWFGSIQTKHSGLYHYDGASFTSYGKEDGLCDNFVTGFLEDKNGLFWIRTGSILCTFDGETFSPFINENGEVLKNIGLILEDQDQNIWLGGRFGHL